MYVWLLVSSFINHLPSNPTESKLYDVLGIPPVNLAFISQSLKKVA